MQHCSVIYIKKGYINNKKTKQKNMYITIYLINNICTTTKTAKGVLLPVGR